MVLVLLEGFEVEALLPAEGFAVEALLPLAVDDPFNWSLLEVELALPASQLPRTFTEWPTCAERSSVLFSLANLPFFSSNTKLPFCERIQPVKDLSSFLVVVVCVVVVWVVVVCALAFWSLLVVLWPEVELVEL